MPTWGKAGVVGTVGAGGSYSSMVETKRGDGQCDDDEEDCAFINNKNSASGFGRAMTVGVAFPGVFGKRSIGAPSLLWTRHTMTIDGQERMSASPSSSLNQTTESAAYALSLDQYRAGLLIAAKMKKKSIAGAFWRVDIGYATGSMSTTMTPAAGSAVDGNLRGLVWNFSFGLTVSPSKHVHLMATPLGFTWMRLKPSDPELLPFLVDDRTRVFQCPFLLELMVSF